MRTMKKLAAALLAASLLLVLLASCGMYGASDVVGMPEGAPKSMDYASAADDSGMLLLSESYRKLTENPFYYTQNVNKSYFSLDSFTASYANLRRYIQNNQAINGDIIKTDELINYFHYDYPRPAEGETFLASAALTDAPWNADHKLLTLAVTTKEADPFDNQGRNFVFLIDVSGSMSGAGRLPLVKEALSLLIDELADSDTVSIVTYASGVSVKADGLRGTQKNRLKSIVNGLNASGGTYGEGGINKAYEIAAKHFVSGGNNRIIVASDGDFNIGASSQTGLEQLITGKRESGVYLRGAWS